MRLFLAINLPAPVSRAVHAAAAPLREAAPDIRWLAPERLHLTLKFLGEQREATAGVVGEAMTAVGQRHRPIDVAVDGAGAFPNFRRPRVVWVGVTPDPRLELLHHDVETACEALGFALDGRAFRPHITLARVRPGDAPVETRRALARAARRVSVAVPFTVASVDLMMSTLSTSGARYDVVAAAPLERA